MGEKTGQEPIMVVLFRELELLFDTLVKEGREEFRVATETIPTQNVILTLLRILQDAAIPSDAMPDVIRGLQALDRREGVGWSAAYAHMKGLLSEFEKSLEQKEVGISAQ